MAMLRIETPRQSRLSGRWHGLASRRSAIGERATLPAPGFSIAFTSLPILKKEIRQQIQKNFVTTVSRLGLGQ
jgi:hypothetical protein